MSLILGTYIDQVKCISFKDLGRILVKTLGNKTIPDSIRVECRKSLRESYPVGTLFTTDNVKICKKPDGRIYARAKDQMIYPI